MLGMNSIVDLKHHIWLIAIATKLLRLGESSAITTPFIPKCNKDITNNSQSETLGKLPVNSLLVEYVIRWCINNVLTDNTLNQQDIH